MNIPAPVVAALISGVVALFGYFWTTRVARRNGERQNEVALSAEARQWLTTAQADARTAKDDAAKATTEAAAATRSSREAHDRADDAERKARAVEAQMDGILRWAERVTRTAQEPQVQAVTDPAVQRLLLLINGGPPGLTSDRLTRPTE